MNDEAAIARLRGQRNQFAFAGVFFLVVSMGIAIPHALHRRTELKRASDELVGYQEAIIGSQQKIKQLQAEIVSTQRAIEELLKKPAPKDR